MVDVVEYCDRPVRKKDGGMLNPNNIPWTHHIPEDEWTVVVRPQKKTWGNQGSSRGQSDTPGKKKMDEVRLYSDELEEITDGEVPLDIRSEVPWIPGMLPKGITEKEIVTIKVNPIVKQRPDEIGAGLSDGEDGRDIGSVKVIVRPPRREHQEMGAITKREELFSDGRGVGQNQRAKETSVGTLMVIKDDLIEKPGPSPVIVDVSEEIRTNEGTTEVCVFDNLKRLHWLPVKQRNLKHLHWLPVKQRITYKLLLLTYKAVHQLAPPYINELVQLKQSSRQLRSSNLCLLQTPKARLKTYGDVAFSVAAPAEWNNFYSISLLNISTKHSIIVMYVQRLRMVKTSFGALSNLHCHCHCHCHLCRNETTKREVSTELLDISRQWIPQGFLRLAEEAKFVGVGNTPSGMMIEVLPEIAEVTGPTGDSISWKREEDSEESAVSLGEAMREITSIRFDVGQLMRWPDRNSDDKLICEPRMESELFSHDPAWREAEPVFVTAESEIFTPVFAGGSLLSRTPWLWQRQLHREFLFCRRLEANSRPVCLRPLAERTGGV